MIASIKLSKKMKVMIALFLAALMSLTFLNIKSYAADPTANTTATIQINGGTRTISTVGTVTLPDVGLTGLKQTSSLNLAPVNVTDATGTGAGWHVSLSSPVVTAGTKTLDAGLLKIDPVNTVDKIDPTSSNVPTISTSTAQAIDTGAVTLVSAATGDGMGSYAANMKNLTLTIPANAYAGIYSTTLTYDLITAP